MHKTKNTAAMSHERSTIIMWILLSAVCVKEQGVDQLSGAVIWELLGFSVAKCNKKPFAVQTQNEIWAFKCISSKSESKAASAKPASAVTWEQETNRNKMPEKTISILKSPLTINRSLITFLIMRHVMAPSASTAIHLMTRLCKTCRKQRSLLSV